MASFFMSFIKAGIRSANEMKNFAWDKIKGLDETGAAGAAGVGGAGAGVGEEGSKRRDEEL